MNKFVESLIARQENSSGLQNVKLENFPEKGTDTVITVKALTIADRMFMDNVVQDISKSIWLTDSRNAIKGVAIVARCARTVTNGSLLFVDEFDGSSKRRTDQEIDQDLTDSINNLVRGWREPPESWVEWGDQILKKLDPNAEAAEKEPDEPGEIDEAAHQAGLEQLENTLDSVSKNS